MHDLLHDPIIGVKTAGGPRPLSLPALITALLRREVLHYTGQRAHQADPWHVFLVQIAASIMARQPEGMEPPAEEAFWRAGLLDLADGCASAWELVVDDVTQPAFMQHPLPNEGDLSKLKPQNPKARAPDELDVLVTSKNHDIKMARINDDIEAWTYAIVTYQTISGYLRLYGSIRMNSGYGSRCIVSLTSDPSISGRFVEELRTVRTMREGVLNAGLQYVRQRGVVLTWIEPWDHRGPQFVLSQLEPWFIEAVRPLRLVGQNSCLVALGSTTTKARQIGPQALDSGAVGDPWIPINTEDKKKGRSALTVSASGWSPERVSSMLFQRGFELTPLQRPRSSMTGAAWFIGSVLVRGDGKTKGFHRFSIPVPGRIVKRLLVEDDRDKLGQSAQEFLADADAAASALVAALELLVKSIANAQASSEDSAQRWSKAAAARFDQTWSDDFFPTLWRVTDEDALEVRRQWHRRLVTTCRALLRDSETRLPRPAARRYQALVRAEARLTSGLFTKGLIGEPITETAA